jgi:hypothetical protein
VTGWTPPQPPRKDFLALLGRRWVLVSGGGYETHTRKRFSRFWSRAKAEAVRDDLNRVRKTWELEPDWQVIDLKGQ